MSEKHGHGPDHELWEMLGRDEAPEPVRPLWPDVRRRVYGSERTGWLPRLGFAGAGGFCAVAGLWLGLNLSQVEPTVTGTAEVAWSGSLLDDEALTLDALYLAATAGGEEVSP